MMRRRKTWERKIQKKIVETFTTPTTGAPCCFASLSLFCAHRRRPFVSFFFPPSRCEALPFCSSYSYEKIKKHICALLFLKKKKIRLLFLFTVCPFYVRFVISLLSFISHSVPSIFLFLFLPSSFFVL